MSPSVINLRETIPNRLVNGDSGASRYKLAADSQIVYKNSAIKNSHGELNESNNINNISVNKQNNSNSLNNSNKLKTDAV